MKMFGMCIDKRVVAGVAAVGVLVWILAPQALAAALPLLIIAICPLSMVMMMKMMNATNAQADQGQPEAAIASTRGNSVAAGGEESQDTLGTLTDAAADVEARRN